MKMWKNEIMEYTRYCDGAHIKSSLHAIAPYVGKLRPEVVSGLIDKYSSKNHTIYDPFCGSGTVPLEAWIKGRKAVGVDLNYYAFVLTKAKLFPYSSLKQALKHLNKISVLVNAVKPTFRMKDIPNWVSCFFHPKTLKEIMIWMYILSSKKDFFLMSCLLGILHHQRPGFLSFPSSHGAPYLRNGKYPIDEYPEMYEYRNVYERLYQKVVRSYKNIPDLDFSIKRKVLHKDTQKSKSGMATGSIIITSPPYMKSLTYARDNRLRLWFLGHPDWEQLDKRISVAKTEFSILMENCFKSWDNFQSKGNYCILVVGDIMFNNAKQQSIPDLICVQAEKFNYKLMDLYDYPINMGRKVVKTDSQIKTEKICVFQRR
jgi:hypothetical protein